MVACSYYDYAEPAAAWSHGAARRASALPRAVARCRCFSAAHSATSLPRSPPPPSSHAAAGAARLRVIVLVVMMAAR